MIKEENGNKKEIIISDARDFKGVWIPKKLYLTRDFTPNEKFVLLEIYSLTNSKNKQCFASNKHFADFVGLKENTIQKMILKFEKAGYLKRFFKYKKDTKEIERRIIILSNKFYDSFINEKADGDENNPYPDGEKSIGGHGEKSIGGMDKKSEISNTGISNTNIKCNKLSDTPINASNSKELEDTINASFSEEKERVPYLDMNNCTLDEIKNHYAVRCKRIAENYNITDTKKIDDLSGIIAYFCQRYYETFGKHHPVLSDRALERLFINFGFPPELLYEYNITAYEDYKELIDRYFTTEYGKYRLSGVVPDYSISHFMSDEILTNLCKNAFNIPHI